MQKKEIRVGIKNKKGESVSFKFVFTEKGDVYATPNFKSKEYRSHKISLHPSNGKSPENYQSFSSQYKSGSDNTNRHIQQTIGNLDIGNGLLIRQVFLIHRSVMVRNDMFDDKKYDCYIEIEDNEEVLDITIFSSKKKFKGTPGKKDGYQKMFDIRVKDLCQFCLVYRGRKLWEKEKNKLKEFAKRRIENTDGVCALIGNSEYNSPVVTYIDTNQIKV